MANEKPMDGPHENARADNPRDGEPVAPIIAVRQERRHYARGLRMRIILRMEDGTPVARLLRP